MSADTTILLRRVDDGIATTAVWPLSAIRAALTAAGYAVEQGWRTIDTAPRDGTAVLLWAPDYADHPGIGRWNEIVGAWDADIGCMADGPGIMADECDGPTHWRPLPAPPAGEATP